MLTYDKLHLVGTQENHVNLDKYHEKAHTFKKSLLEKLTSDKKNKGEKIIDKKEVLKVLNRAADDNLYRTKLMESDSKVLDDTNLNNETKAAIMSGDINWLENNVGKLSNKELIYLRHRLEMEKW